MTRGREDPELAERTLLVLAATNDRELAAAIHQAMSRLIQAAEARRSHTSWRQAPATEQAAHTTLQRCAASLASLPVDSELRVVISAVSAVLGRWWPETPASAARVSAAVEQLRAAAMHQPALVRDARRVAAGG